MQARQWQTECIQELIQEPIRARMIHRARSLVE
jgi:hypothetical protein